MHSAEKENLFTMRKQCETLYDEICKVHDECDMRTPHMKISESEDTRGGGYPPSVRRSVNDNDHSWNIDSNVCSGT